MNSLVIPPSLNWYQTKIWTCAPDNTLIYGSNNSLIVIKAAPLDKPADVSVIMCAHLDRVLGVSLGQWSPTKKQITSFGEDKYVKLWNMIDNSLVNSHNSHTISKSKIVGADFAGEHKIVSVSEDGLIVIWRTNEDQKVPIKHLLGIKVQVTSVSSCPHATWLMAFGLRNGLVIVADLRATGSVMYKLRSHDHDVLDLAWCPVPLNVIPKKEITREVKDSSEDSSFKNGSDGKGSSLEESTNSETSSASKPKEIVDENTSKTVPDQEEVDSHDTVDGNTKTVPDREEEVETHDTVDALPANGTHLNNCKTEKELISAHKLDKKNLWVNLKHADDDEQMEADQGREPPTALIDDTSFDFIKECNELKAKIEETLDESLDITIKELAEVEETMPKEPPVKVIESESDALKKPAVEAKEFLLASSARGGCICIWRAGTDGRLQMKLNLPKSKSHGRRQHHHHHRDSAWITLNWISPDVLLSSGCNGELHRWDLLDSKPQAILVHNDHPKQLFSMCSPAYSTLTLDHEEVKKEDLAVWSMGRDRNIFYTSILERKVLRVYPTLGCAVQIIRSSPIDPNRIAMGFGDGSIRIWDLGKPHLQFITMLQIKLRVGAKVLSLAWHPHEEFVLAYGTDEGQVGYVNPTVVSKPASLFAQHFRSAIYNLEWAPFPGKPDTVGLYACSEGTVGIFDLNNTIASPVMVILPKKEFITQIAWKPDHTKLALGCKNGAIYLLNNNHEVESTIYYQKKGISCLSWHPMATAEDEEQSENHHWLSASTTTDTNIVIYNTNIKADEENMKDLIVGELNGHVKSINQIIWSPYKNGQLVTLSDDGTAIVWVDMKAVSTLINFNADSFLTGVWSTVSEDHIITAGRDCSLRIWNIHDNPLVEQSQVEDLRTKRKKIVQQLKGKKDEKAEESNAKQGKKVTLFPNAAGRQADIKLALQDCRSLLEMSETCSGDNKTENNSVLQMLSAQTPDEFGKLMDDQGESHKIRSKYALQQHLSLWRGNIGDAVKEAITEGNLTPWLISITPMVSFKLWQEACEAYAAQLIENPSSDPVEIVSYFLSCHKVDAAIEVLCERQMYREALVLAKNRKPNDQDAAKEIMRQWAKNCLINGRFEVAAQNYIALGEYEEAAKVLYKRSDCEALALAVDLAKRSENPELLATVTYRYNTFKNHDNDLVALPTILDATLKLCNDSQSNENDTEKQIVETE